MTERKVVDRTSGTANAVGPFSVYSAGGLFTEDELATNVLIKEAVWRLSNGKFQLILPQFRELRDLDRPDVEAYLRNNDLLEVLTSDLLLARFDGLELDAGTVVEFAMAKFLGKPTVILRCDFRRLSNTGLSEPYNLMVMNWPRVVEVHLHSYEVWAGLLTEARKALGDNAPVQATMNAELSMIEKSVDEIAPRGTGAGAEGRLQAGRAVAPSTRVRLKPSKFCRISGLEAALEMKSPYPPEYQEVVYKAARISPGSGFDQMLTESKLDQTIQRLRKNGTL